MAEMQMDMTGSPDNRTRPGVGPRLKAARESAGLTLAQMSATTKIPTRMLTLMEAGDFAALPAKAYATGFTRTYARALGLDDKAYVAAVRSEVGLADQPDPRSVPTFEPGDPARVPTARFAWVAAIAGLFVIAAGLFFWRSYYAPAVTLPPIAVETAAVAPAPVPVQPAVPLAVPPAAPLAGSTEAAVPAPPPPGAALAPAPAAPAARRSAAAPVVGAAPAGDPAAATPAAVPAPASTAQF